MSDQTGEELDAVSVPEHIWRKEAKHVLDQIKNHACAEPFLEPVDPVLHDCPDYFKKVKDPMDLGTISSHLESYSSPLAFANDVRLTFENAKTYNPRENMVYEYAEVMLAVFDNMWSVTTAGANTTESKRRSRSSTSRFAPGHDNRNPASNGAGASERKADVEQTKSKENGKQDDRRSSHPTAERGKGARGAKTKPPVHAAFEISSKASSEGVVPARTASRGAVSGRRPFASSKSSAAGDTSPNAEAEGGSVRAGGRGTRRGRERKGEEGEEKRGGGGESHVGRRGKTAEAEEEETDGGSELRRRRGARRGHQREDAAAVSQPNEESPGGGRQGRQGRGKGEKKEEEAEAGNERQASAEGGRGGRKRRRESTPTVAPMTKILSPKVLSPKVLSPKSPRGARVSEEALESVKQSCREMLSAAERGLSGAVAAAMRDAGGAEEGGGEGEEEVVVEDDVGGADEFGDEFGEEFMDGMDDECVPSIAVHAMSSYATACSDG